MKVLKNLIEEKGARVVARELVDKHIQNFCGISIDDLPDTSELCDVIDDLEEVLSEDEFTAKQINNILSRIDFNFVQELIYH